MSQIETARRANIMIASLKKPDVLAAVRGQGMDEYITDSVRERPFYRAVVSISESFSGIAENPHELLARLQMLYPARNANAVKESAYYKLVQHNAFRFVGKVVDGVQVNHDCTGVNLTRTIFEAWGACLAAPWYQERFMETIVKKP